MDFQKAVSLLVQPLLGRDFNHLLNRVSIMSTSKPSKLIHQEQVSQIPEPDAANLSAFKLCKQKRFFVTSYIVKNKDDLFLLKKNNAMTKCFNLKKAKRKWKLKSQKNWKICKVIV